MKYIKLLSVLLITLLVGIMPASAGVSNRDVNRTADGAMEKSGTTGYVTVNASSLSKEEGALNTTGSQVLRVTNTTSGSGAVRFSYATFYDVLAGEKYRITGQVQCADAEIIPRIYRLGGIVQTLYAGVAGLNSFDFVATMSEDGYIGFYNSESTAPYDKYCEWDNLSVTRYYGKVQNREVALGTDLNFEKAGVTDFGVVFSINTKETNDRGDEGNQFLRVEHNGGVGNAYATQNPFVVGVPHRIRGYWRTGDATYLCRMVAYGVGGVTIGTTASTTWIPFDYTFTPNYTTLGLGSTMISGVGSYCDYDNVSITRYYGTVQNRETNLYTNGSFDVDTSTWTEGNSATFSLVDGAEGFGQALRITAGATTSRAVPNFTIAVGQTVRVRGWARSDGTNTPILNWVGNSTAPLGLATPVSTDWQYFDTTITSPQTTQLALLCNNATSLGYCEFDNVSVTRKY